MRGFGELTGGPRGVLLSFPLYRVRGTILYFSPEGQCLLALVAS